MIFKSKESIRPVSNRSNVMSSFFGSDLFTTRKGVSCKIYDSMGKIIYLSQCFDLPSTYRLNKSFF